ncbi:MAG: hypothetical protein J2P23_09155 [Microlunatus sp.]|nr:hypothetical protein [Microlunatus sp.]
MTRLRALRIMAISIPSDQLPHIGPRASGAGRRSARGQTRAQRQSYVRSF